MLVSYWDSGYVKLDVDDPANPEYLGDTSFDGPDPLTGHGTRPRATPTRRSSRTTTATSSRPTRTSTHTVHHHNRQPAAGLRRWHPGHAGRRAERRPAADAGRPARGRHAVYRRWLHPGRGPRPAARRDGRRRGARDVRLRRQGGQRGRCRLRRDPDLQQRPGSGAALRRREPEHDLRRPERGHPGAPDPAVDRLPNHGRLRRRDVQLRAERSDEHSRSCPATGRASRCGSASSSTAGATRTCRTAPASCGRSTRSPSTEGLDERYATDFGDLTVHEFATDATENVAYSSYYAGGMRVFTFGAEGLTETGKFIDRGGNNFWGVEQFTLGNQRYFAGSDRDFGLYILRYTGPGAAQKRRLLERHRNGSLQALCGRAVSLLGRQRQSVHPGAAVGSVRWHDRRPSAGAAGGPTRTPATGSARPARSIQGERRGGRLQYGDRAPDRGATPWRALRQPVRGLERP